MIGFAFTLVAVILYSWFTLRQVNSLRLLQAETVERNRLDSLQLLRIQDALNSLGLALHDVVEEPYPPAAFEPQFRRLLAQLEDGIRKESGFASGPRETANEQLLNSSLQLLKGQTDVVFEKAKAGDDQAAVALIRNSLRPRRDELSAQVSRMLVENNEMDQQTEAAITRIYDRVERDLYTFLLATVAAIGITGVALAFANRRLFRHLSDLSMQKSTLARKLISLQEEVLRSVSRELHDEFGQIFTAIGAMLSRLERKGVPPDSPVRADLAEVRAITQSALEKVRSLSQMLHPAVLDDYGLEKAVEWYVPQFEKQTGIGVKYEKSGAGPPIGDEKAIHVYRILQEALNNVARHSGSKWATVRVHYAPDQLRLEVEDHGAGLRPTAGHTGLGLVAMRERAELLKGDLRLQNVPQGGTLVSLKVPISHDS